MSEEYKLEDKCITQEAEYSDSFVGIHFHEGKFEIYFPIGFELPTKQNCIDLSKIELEKKIRKDILKLISILRFYKNKDRTKKENSEALKKEFTTNNFPIYSYIYIFNWYKKNGYYRPKEIIFKQGKNGKINWNRTIKQTSPYVIDNNVVYLDFIVRKETYNDEEIIAHINRFCVYESFNKIGCLFTSKMPKKESIKLSNKKYISILKKKIETTFNDEERELFQHMKTILETESNQTSNKDYYFGTENFNNIWEKMIDEVYGISKEDPDFLRPHVFWKIKGTDKKPKFTLKPDTIMILDSNPEDKKIFVLDAKYYRAGEDLTQGSLPGGDSALKQMVYAEKFKKDPKYKNYKIYNAFILPSHLTNPENIETLGETEEDWLYDITDEYTKVQGIRLDTRKLMYNHKKGTNEIFEQLANCIEEEFNKSKEIENE